MKSNLISLMGDAVIANMLTVKISKKMKENE